MGTNALASLLAKAPVSSVEQVMALMRGLDTALPDNDGVKWFNHLYLRVTEAVARELAAGPAYHDPAFIARLDVVFANLYFQAIVSAQQGNSQAPPAWRPLFESRGERRARIQHALAGMNAHINRDLPLALVQTWRERGGPHDADPRREDFDRVNGLLQRVENEIKSEYAIGLVGLADVAAGSLDDVVAMWSVARARDAAWTSGEVLWTLAPTPKLADRYFARLDQLTGFAGRGLVAPLVTARL